MPNPMPVPTPATPTLAPAIATVSATEDDAFFFVDVTVGARVTVPAELLGFDIVSSG
jgi:hypothetical protein